VSNTCLLVGITTTLEMRPVESLLRAHFPASHLRCVDRLSAAGRDDLSADLIVICQSWSDEFTASEVAGLLAAAPLARVLCVYGRWCDSDGRTRRHWPLAVRVPVADFARRLKHEITVLMTGTAPLPWTATRTELFAGLCQSADDNRIPSGGPTQSGAQAR